MKKLKQIKFTQIKDNEIYIILWEEYSRVNQQPPTIYKARGKDVIKLIKNTFLYDGFFEENGVSNLKHFLAEAWANNGDGNDIIEVYKLPLL